jgi:hypothetical protein
MQHNSPKYNHKPHSASILLLQLLLQKAQLLVLVIS